MLSVSHSILNYVSHQLSQDKTSCAHKWEWSYTPALHDQHPSHPTPFSAKYLATRGPNLTIARRSERSRSCDLVYHPWWPIVLDDGVQFLTSQAKSAFVFNRLTLKFDRSPWKTYSTSSLIPLETVCLAPSWVQSKFIVHKSSNRGQIDTFLDLEIWQMTLKNNRDSFLCLLHLCVAFHRHPWIQRRIINHHPESLKSGSNRYFFGVCDLDI